MTTINESYDSLQPPSVEELKDILYSSHIPTHIIKTVEEAMELLYGMDTESSEYNNTLSYINYLVKLPWNKKTEDKTDFVEIDRILQETCKISPDVKSKIMDTISSKLQKRNRQVKILVVDDEKIALKNLSYLLNKEGYDVVTSESGEDAVEILKGNEFDIVMTDLKMAGMDGIQVLKATKSMYPDTHVILITGYATTETAVEAMRKGAFHYIMKPVQLDELRLMIKEALSLSKPRPLEQPVLCLTSESGSRKSDIGKAVAEAFGRNFFELSLENVKTESDISGFSRINGAVSPGCIIEHICRTGTSNLVIMLNDIDKLDKDLFSLLYNVINPDKNRYFVDKYLEEPFDLSDVLFIASASRIKDISSPLIEWLDIVEV